MGIAMILVAAGLLAAARFAVAPARTRRTWLVALVATELGQVWAVVAAILAVWAASRVGDGGTIVETALRAGAAAGAAIAAGLFTRPVLSAARLAGRARRELADVFGARGAREETTPLWSWTRLLIWPMWTRRVAVETHDADGLSVDFYRPAGGAPSAGAPCVVLVHGGGWDSGDRAQLAGFNHWLAARGVAVASLSYRLAPAHRWPAQRDDVRAGVAWVRANATRLGIDPARLTLLGRSAGAQIATAAAFGEVLPGVRAVVALYGCFDLEFVWSIRSEKDALNSDKLLRQFLGGPPDGARAELFRSGSAEKLVHAGVPPTLIIHGVLDELVWCRHSERLAAALKAAGVPHVLLRLPWATHAGEANLHGPSGQLITGAVLRVAAGG
jgi:acetyl esterase/lipase